MEISHVKEQIYKPAANYVVYGQWVDFALFENFMFLYF